MRPALFWRLVDRMELWEGLVGEVVAQGENLGRARESRPVRKVAGTLLPSVFRLSKPVNHQSASLQLSAFQDRG